MKNKKMLKKLCAFCSVVMLIFAMAVPAFATGGEVDYADEAVSAMTAGLAEVTGTLTINNILTVILAVLGIAVGFMFFWWGLRKIIGIAKRAFTRGQVSV